MSRRSSAAAASLPRRRPVVLMYHGFSDHRRPDDPENLFVTGHALRAQLEQLLASGWRPLSLAEYLGVRRGEATANRRFLLTIDDGYVSTADIAAPILADLGVPAVLFVPAGLIGRTARWLPQPAHQPLLDEAGLRALVHAGGFEIGGHGFDHRRMSALNATELRRQVVDVRDRLAAVTGRAPRAFAYPYGDMDAGARQAVAAAGYDVGFSVFVDAGRFAVSRIDVNATDTLTSLPVKLVPSYRSLWRAAGRLGPLRRAVRHATTRQRAGAGA